MFQHHEPHNPLCMEKVNRGLSSGCGCSPLTRSRSPGSPRPLLCGHEPWPSGGLASLGLTRSAAEPDPMEERGLTLRAQKRFVEVAGKTLRVTWSLSLSGGKRDEVLLGTGSLAVTMRASSLGWHRRSMSQNQTHRTPGHPWPPPRPPSSAGSSVSCCSSLLEKDLLSLQLKASIHTDKPPRPTGPREHGLREKLRSTT